MPPSDVFRIEELVNAQPFMLSSIRMAIIGFGCTLDWDAVALAAGFAETELEVSRVALGAGACVIARVQARLPTKNTPMILAARIANSWLAGYLALLLFF